MTDGTNRTFAVIGLGTFGGTVAADLARFGNRVLGIDFDEARVGQLADALAEAVIADARDEDALEEAGVGGYDVALIAIGERLEAAVLATMNVKLLGVPCVWVKATERTHHRIMVKLGADRVIEPEREIGRHIAQMLHNPLVRDYVSLGNGFHIVDVRVPKALDGARLAELDVAGRFELRCLGVMRGPHFLEATDAEVRLEADDMLLLLGRRQELRAFADSL